MSIWKSWPWRNRSKEPAKSKLLEPDEFRRQYLLVLRQQFGDLIVLRENGLSLKIKVNQVEHDTFLDNAYLLYQKNPTQLRQILRNYVAGYKDMQALREADASRDKILPVIKDDGYVDEMLHSLRKRGTDTSKFEILFDRLCDGLLITYAIDTPHSLRYLRSDDLVSVGVERPQLQYLAMENLRLKTHTLQWHDNDGIYLGTLDGTYEASLLLLPEVFEEVARNGSGRLVLAVPSRDVVLVCDADCPSAVERIQLLAQGLHQQAAYAVSPHIFHWQDGQCEKWSE